MSLFPIKLNTVAMISYWLPFVCHYIWTIARRQTGEGAPTIKMEIVLSVLSLDPGVCLCAYNLSIVLVKIVVFRTHRRNFLASTTQELRQILNICLGQGGVLDNQPSKCQFPCTFCQWIEPYSLVEAAFYPYFRSSSMTCTHRRNDLLLVAVRMPLYLDHRSAPDR